MSNGSQTGIVVKLGFFPLAWILYFCTPRVEIDGKVETRPWGTHVFPTTAGTHTVKIYFPYLINPQCGANTIDVTVTEGNLTRVQYNMPPWMLAKGSLKVV